MSARSVRTAIVLATMTCLVLGLLGVTAAAMPSSHPGGAAHGPASPGVVVYEQPPSPAGGLYQSSRNGTDYDAYVWDGFPIAAGQVVTLTEILWRGGYDPARFGSGGPVLDFTVSIYPSIPGGSQPDPLHPLVQYPTGGAAGETFAGMFGNARMYDYDFVLAPPFQLPGPGKYWVQIEASQRGIPDWGLAAATGGDAAHYLGLPAAGDMSYFYVGGDTAFTLRGFNSAPIKVHLPFVQR